MNLRTLFFAVALLAPPLSAQSSSWFVDGDSGSDGGSGSSADPFHTIRHALSVASAGDQILLIASTFNHSDESFPLSLRSDVDIDALDAGHLAILDGEGTATAAFLLDSAMDAGINLTDLGFTDFGDCIEVTSTGSTEGFVLNIDGCLFQAFTGTGVLANFSASGTQVLWVQNSTFQGNAAVAGVDVTLQSNSNLRTSVVEDCQIQNCATGVSWRLDGVASVGAFSTIQRNFVSDCPTVGVRVSLATDGGIVESSGVVRGNAIENCGIGLELIADADLGFNAAIRGDVKWNRIRNNGTNVRCETRNNGASFADITSEFEGNVIAGATTAVAGGTGVGVALDATMVRTGFTNLSPNFGLAPYGGRNSINTNEVFDVQMLNEAGLNKIFDMEKNFWSQSLEASVFARIDISNGALYPYLGTLLLDSFSAPLTPSTIDPHAILNIQSAADATGAFVDDDDAAGPYMQAITLLQQGTVAWSVDSTVTYGGTTLFFETPDLLPGEYNFLVTNPGGSIGVGSLKVREESTVKSDTGCFVATAAHGAYDAQSVLKLRRFRDDYLAATTFGRTLIRSYYRWGPSWAAWIEDRPWARKTAWTLLQAPVLMVTALQSWSAGVRLM
ncbi:MAG: DUF1565 domain-containing protein, partial [Planctomycetes bacterium]|nr:DUF1565 domain-containing protein [Planctomycetota bacterium]